MDFLSAFDFERKANVNKFDIGAKYNEFSKKQDYLGFFSWLSTVVAISLRKLVKNMIDNLKQGFKDAKIAEVKGNKVEDKSNLPDPAIYEYQNQHPEAFQSQADGIFKAIGMGDGRYFHPEYISRAACIDELINRYVQDKGGKILNSKGKNITKAIIREAHRSISLSEGIFSFKYSLEGKEHNICLLEQHQAEQIDRISEGFLDRSSDKIGDYLVFDMDVKEIKEAVLNYELQRNEETKRRANTEEEAKEPEIAQKVKETETAEKAEKDPHKTEKEVHEESRANVLGVKHYKEIKDGEYKLVMRAPAGKEAFEKEWEEERKDKKNKSWKKLRNFNEKAKQEITEASKGKDLKEVFVKISIDSSLLDSNGLYQVPLSKYEYPNGIENPSKGKYSCFIRIPDLNLGHGTTRKEEHKYEEKDKDGKVVKEGKNYIITLSLAESFPLLTRDGNTITVNGKEMRASATDLLSNFTLQGYCVEPKKVPGKPEAYIANKAKGDEKAITFDEKTTKISEGTVKDNPVLEELDFNHVKAVVKAGAFKNLSSEIKIRNAENVTFEPGAFENANRLVVVEPDIISDNKDAILADLASKAASIGASYAANTGQEVSTDVSQAEEKVEETLEMEETDRKLCEQAEEAIRERNREIAEEEQPPHENKDRAFAIGSNVIIAEEINGIVKYVSANPLNAANPAHGTASSMDELRQRMADYAEKNGLEVTEIPYNEAMAKMNALEAASRIQGQNR